MEEGAITGLAHKSFTVASGKMGFHMAMECIRATTSLKEYLLMDSSLGMVYRLLLMETNMWENMLMGLLKATGNIHGLMEAYTKGTLKMVLDMAMESGSTTRKSTKETTGWIKSKGWECTHGSINKSIEDNSGRTLERATDNLLLCQRATKNYNIVGAG